MKIKKIAVLIVLIMSICIMCSYVMSSCINGKNTAIVKMNYDNKNAGFHSDNDAYIKQHNSGRGFLYQIGYNIKTKHARDYSQNDSKDYESEHFDAYIKNFNTKLDVELASKIKFIQLNVYMGGYINYLASPNEKSDFKSDLELLASMCLVKLSSRGYSTILNFVYDDITVNEPATAAIVKSHIPYIAAILEKNKKVYNIRAIKIGLLGRNGDINTSKFDDADKIDILNEYLNYIPNEYKILIDSYNKGILRDSNNINRLGYCYNLDSNDIKEAKFNPNSSIKKENIGRFNLAKIPNDVNSKDDFYRLLVALYTKSISALDITDIILKPYNSISVDYEELEKYNLKVYNNYFINSEDGKRIQVPAINYLSDMLGYRLVISNVFAVKNNKANASDEKYAILGFDIENYGMAAPMFATEIVICVLNRDLTGSVRDAGISGFKSLQTLESFSKIEVREYLGKPNQSDRIVPSDRFYGFEIRDDKGFSYCADNDYKQNTFKFRPLGSVTVLPLR